MEQLNISFSVYPPFFRELAPLPWNKPLEEWDPVDVDFLNIRKGISRHVVKFVKTKKYSVAVKQTTETSAKFEIETYHKLLSLGIHTLIPAGYVLCERPPIATVTPIGVTYENDNLAFVMTILEDKTIPHSLLYAWNFSEDSKLTIWNAISELLATLHFHNIYWGDASLANMLIKFIKIKDEKDRVKTELKAFLADAETVQILPKISNEMREEDINFFFDSMEWLNEDFKNAGISRESFSVEEETKYILKKYKYHYELLSKTRAFTEKTGIDVRRHFKVIKNVDTLNAIYKQIEEHKWYLSEKAKKEVSLKDSAENWLTTIYYPIIAEFEKNKLYTYFPHLNAFSLYVNVMGHKYFMSKKAKKDVGINQAIMDYCDKYAEENNGGKTSMFAMFKKWANNILKIFPSDYLGSRNETEEII